MSIIEILQSIGFNEATLGENDTIVLRLSKDLFAQVITKLVNENKFSLRSLFASDNIKVEGRYKIFALLSFTNSPEWLIVETFLSPDDASYPSVTATVMSAHWYERYMHDMFGIIPKGHPDLRRLVSHENIPEGVYPLRKNFSWNEKFEKANVPYPMLHVKGDGVYEIPVGPIHAGIIEPGHFRFNVAGERILTLEGKLFFTHKGVEKILEGKTVLEGMPFVERLSGDMAASNALAYSQAVENISNVIVPKRAKMLRMLITEMERFTMHIHDLANIGGMGTGYTFIAANGFRIKEKLVRVSNDILGNRFWRGMIVPGGVSKDFNKEELNKLLKVAHETYGEMKKIVEIALSSEGFLDRLQTTGVLPIEAARAFGALGVPARASGLPRDVRIEHPYAAYDEFPVAIMTQKTGDVYARYLIRIDELKETLDLVEKLVKNMAEGETLSSFEIKDGFGIGAVESWRGEILCALEIRNGIIERCFPRDPSFCNWSLFAIIGPGNIVPDFPICNKSLNLSYSGTDM